MKKVVVSGLLLATLAAVAYLRDARARRHSSAIAFPLRLARGIWRLKGQGRVSA